MREILFRAKRFDNGEWIEGHIMNQVYQPNTIEEEWEWFIKPIGSPPWDIGFRVDPETVGEFTGLVDKNCNRIFEGDIVKRFWLGLEIIYRIKYEGENARFIGEALNKSGFTTFDHDGEMFEIIGNIYDNPELLEKVR